MSFVLVTALGLFVANVAWAVPDFQSSRTLSLSQTGRGGALLNDTIMLNQSLLGFQPVAAVAGTYTWFNGTNYDLDGKRRLFNVSVIDGKNQYANAGLAFTRKPDMDLIHVGVSKKIMSNISIGATGKRFALNTNSKAAAGENGVVGYNAGLSASFRIPNPLTQAPIQVGVTADNLSHNRYSEQVLGPRQAGVGTKINLTSILMLYGDVLQSAPRDEGMFTSYHGAAELALTEEFYLRGGLFGFRDTGWSLGAGWLGPKFSLSYGYQNSHTTVSRQFNHSVTMEMYM